MTLLRKALLSGLGSGYLPVAPGTWGSLLAACAWLVAFRYFGGALGSAGFALLTAACAALASIGCGVMGGWAIRRWGSGDPRIVVLDEVAGQWVALIPACWADAASVAVMLTLAGFVAFRLLDILKPYPARKAEALPAGWGIVADDLVAGVYSAILILPLAWAF